MSPAVQPCPDGVECPQPHRLPPRGHLGRRAWPR